jgi:hypothetical protein
MKGKNPIPVTGDANRNRDHVGYRDVRDYVKLHLAFPLERTGEAPEMQRPLLWPFRFKPASPPVARTGTTVHGAEIPETDMIR